MRPRVEAEGALAVDRARLHDYLMLTKPELTLLSVITALGGYYLGSDTALHGVRMLHTLSGTALVGGAAGALNQLIERRYDGVMRRTEQRPLPSGRVSPAEALLFGAVLAIVGIAELTFCVNLLTGILASVTLAAYLFLYTPLKRLTPAATLVGAIPGAIPPLMGWAAATGSVSYEAWLLFAILFFWQMPHFLSLAWMYRKDYARAGYRLLTVNDPEGRRTGLHTLAYTILTVASTLLPLVAGFSGWVYGVAASALGAVFIAAGVAMRRSPSNLAARRLFTISLIYLPLLVGCMIIDRL